MLILFKVKNYMSFKEESILDMRATSYTQHPTHVINENSNIPLLKTSAIYGANASGKSNFITAMFFFKHFVFSQFISTKEDAILEETSIDPLFEPFLLTENNSEPSEFEIVFIHNKKLIQYGFEILHNKILNEWYYIDDKLVFERDENNSLTFGPRYREKLSLYNKMPSERLYLSVLEYFLDDEDKETILGDFISFFSKKFNVFKEILFESSVKRIAGSALIMTKLFDDKDYRNRVQKYLSKIDVGIKRLDVVVESQKQDNGKIHKQKTLKTIHDIYDENGNIIGEKAFDLSQESTGTIRFLSYIQNIVEMINTGGIFIVDEMSARLHPLLTKLIVDIFQDSSNKAAQLIFTTHDISLLNNNQFRRDEVVFADKNHKGESSLYSLSDLKIREDATFHKDYLQGKYGAIPIFEYDSLIGGNLNA